MNYSNKNLCCRLVFMMSCICYFCTESMTQDANPVIVNLSKSLQIYTSNTSLTIKATKSINVVVSTTAMTLTSSPSTNYTSTTTPLISSRKPSSTGETVIMVIFAVLSFIVLVLVISTLTLVRLYCILLFYLAFFEEPLQFYAIKGTLQI